MNVAGPAMIRVSRASVSSAPSVIIKVSKVMTTNGSRKTKRLDRFFMRASFLSRSLFFYLLYPLINLLLYNLLSRCVLAFYVLHLQIFFLSISSIGAVRLLNVTVDESYLPAALATDEILRSLSSDTVKGSSLSTTRSASFPVSIVPSLSSSNEYKRFPGYIS